MIIRTLTLFLLSLFILACVSENEKEDITVSWSVEQLYRSAKGEMADGNYQTAIEQYEILESRFPFGKYATQAQIDVGYAYYKYDELEPAIAAVDRFIKLNPRHQAVDYAYYLKGIINFNRGKSFLDKINERDIADYDKSILLAAANNFEILLRRFPDSKYAADSQQRLIYLYDKLASADLKVAQYYASRDAWIAAANRSKAILQTYPGTSAIRPALEIQLAAYQNLGLDKLAADTQRIIDLNYGDGS
ncbi:MAG: outer membrane protein assembly factor BamD [Gammaproteobacteria bacterium]|nr:outer membrane protein assembly factor BamD [Gammaproteobacteria bacterium]